MPVVDPISPAFALVYSTLHGDATLMSRITGVYQDVAPATATPDYCVVNLQSGVDTLTATAVRVLSRLILQVQIVGPASDGANLRAAFARADTLLQPNGQPLRNQGGTLALYRDGLVSYSEIVSGTLIVHIGGLYRCEV